jgi:hypothetical protein
MYHYQPGLIVKNHNGVPQYRYLFQSILPQTEEEEKASYQDLGNISSLQNMPHFGIGA